MALTAVLLFATRNRAPETFWGTPSEVATGLLFLVGLLCVCIGLELPGKYRLGRVITGSLGAAMCLAFLGVGAWEAWTTKLERSQEVAQLHSSKFSSELAAVDLNVGGLPPHLRSLLTGRELPPACTLESRRDNTAAVFLRCEGLFELVLPDDSGERVAGITIEQNFKGTLYGVAPGITADALRSKLARTLGPETSVSRHYKGTRTFEFNDPSVGRVEFTVAPNTGMVKTVSVWNQKYGWTPDRRR